MQRYELSDGKSHKFWAIDLEGTDVTTQWGRIGTDGQSKVKSFGSVAEAEKERDKLVRSKVKKGYELVGEVEAPAKAAVVAAPMKPAVAPPPEPIETASTPPAAKPAPQPLAEGAVSPEAAAAPVETSVASALVVASDELPDEARPDLEALAKDLPPNRATRRASVKVPTVEKAWKDVYDPNFRGGRSTFMVDDGCAGAASLFETFEKGSIPSLGDDPETIGRHAAGILAACGSKLRHRDLFDLLVAAHGLADAVLATAVCFGHRQKPRVEPGEGLEATDALYRYEGLPSMIARMRDHLSAASEADHAAALAAARAFASQHELGYSRATVLALAFPDADELVAPAIAAATEPSLGGAVGVRLALLETARDSAQLVALHGGLHSVDVIGDGYRTGYGTVAGAIERLGEGAAEYLVDCLAPQRSSWADKEHDRRLARLMAATPSDATMQFLAERIDDPGFRTGLAPAAQAFPVRALRILGPLAVGRSKHASVAQQVVGSVLRRHPTALAAAADGMDAGALAALQKLAEASTTSAPADLASCPEVLQKPRWLAKKKAKGPKKVALEPLAHAPSMRWPEGVKEQFEATATPSPRKSMNDDEWRKSIQGDYRIDGICHAPEAVALERMESWRPADSWYIEPWIRAVVARFELDAIEVVRSYAANLPAYGLAVALPYDDDVLAPIAADAYRRLKSARATAREWLRLHAECAFVALLPAALGGNGKEKTSALAAIGYLASEGFGPLLIEVGGRYGDDARKAAELLADADPLDQLPKKIPALPSWATEAIPPELTAGGSLPTAAFEAFLTMLAISRPGELYPGVEMALEHLEPSTVARFSWSLFEAWRMNGMDSKESWAFTQMGALGDDECARKLTPILRVWPGEGGHARATTGLDVLCEIGSDVALMNLYGISQKLKFKGLKNKAAEKVQEIARDRGLTELELADRLVPDFDLDPTGTLTLDFGPRAFTVTFDEHLAPVIRDEGGKLRKSLPKVGAKDDAEKGAAATKQFKTLKKDVRAVAGMQVMRLEQAMCDERTWSAEDFRQFLVDHPLVVHLTRRLVWGLYPTDGGAPTQTFRVAEDGTFADREDEELELPEGVRVGIVHRLRMSDDEAAAWGEVFGDYEILQPFDQLGRSVHQLTDEEIATNVIKRYEGLEVKTSQVLRLEKMGWRRGDPQDGGGIWWMQRDTGSGYFLLSLDPGMIVGLMDEYPEQTLGTVDLHETAWRWGDGRSFEGLSDVMLSEVIRSLETLRS